MPKIPDETLRRIKAEIPVEIVVRETGVELRVQGKDLVGCCPFHAEKTASLSVTPAKALWHCFGCDAGGDVLAWVMRSQGIPFRQAAEVLIRRLDGVPVELRPAMARKKRTSVPTFASPVGIDDDNDESMNGMIRFYAANLLRTEKGKAYLRGRGLDSAELWEHFSVGYADGTLGWYVPASDRNDGKLIRERLARLGVLRETTNKEHFDGCVVWPVWDEGGRVAQIYGRRIGRANPKWGSANLDKLVLPGRPVSVLWNRAALTESNEIVLCEGVIDGATYWCHGIRNVVATLGAGTFGDEQQASFVRHGVRKVWIAYDRDDAGDAGAAAVVERLGAVGIDCYRVQFPRGMDVNEYAQKVQPAARSLELSLAGAQWLGTGKPPSFRMVAAAGAPASEPRAPQAHALAPARSASPLRAVAAQPLREEPEEDAAGEESIREAPGVLVEPAPAVAPAALPGGLVPESLTDDEAVFRIDDRHYRLRGLKKTTGQSAKLNVTASRVGVGLEPGAAIPGMFVDVFDLFHAKARWSFQKSAAGDLGVREETIKGDLGRLLLAVESIQTQRTAALLAPKAAAPAMTPEEHADALELASDENYFDRVLGYFGRGGLVGETTNKLVAWIAATSRRLERPLAVIIQSSSSAGKSALMDAVLAFLPEEEKEKYSAVTGKALFYIQGENGLAHKVLAISEEEGAETASYALKMLQSEGELSIISTGKDGSTGRLVTHEYRVKGPVMILLTTTRVELDEELQNRCLVLTVDESREQTERIHRMQRERETLDGLLAEEDKPRIRRLMQNAQRILRPVRVMNPYAPQLEFLGSQLRMRRDHEKYLALIRSIAYLGQFQRPTKTAERGGKAFDYIEVRKADIALANRLAGEVLGRSLDELSPQTRRFLDLLGEMVVRECERLAVQRADFRFRAKDVRRHTGWSGTQTWFHLDRLARLEYVATHRAPGGLGFVYELVYDGAGRDGRRFLPGLVDVDRLVEPAPGSGTVEGHSG